MAEQKAELTCKDCGKTFEAFLNEIAEHNAKIKCPHCGSSNKGKETDTRKT